MYIYEKTLGAFQRQVNFAIERKIGMSFWDLPDTIDFNDYYWEGIGETDFWNMVEAATDDVLNDNGLEADIYSFKPYNRCGAGS